MKKGRVLMVYSKKLVYPAFIKQDDEGVFGVYFPNLFPDAGWDFPLSEGVTKLEAIKKAKKDLAYSLAGTLYDNEDLPEPTPIPITQLSERMELIDVETIIDHYLEEINEHLKSRHWHIENYVEEYNEYIEAIGYKNEQGKWDILFGDYSEEEETQFFDTSYKKSPESPYNTILFSVNLRSEAQEQFNQFVENVILKHRTSKEWSDRKKERIESKKNFNESLFQVIDEKVNIGEITEEEAILMKTVMNEDLDN